MVDSCIIEVWEKCQVCTIQLKEKVMSSMPIHIVKGKGEKFVASPDYLAYLSRLEPQFHKHLLMNCARLWGVYKYIYVCICI